jgi:hypothetical protein
VSTFRELAGRHISDARDELTSHGEICDGHGVLEGAMVDAAEAAVHEWLIAEFMDWADLQRGGRTSFNGAEAVDILIQKIKPTWPQQQTSSI